MLSGPRESLQYELLGRSSGCHNPRKLTYPSPTAPFKVDPNPAFFLLLLSTLLQMLQEPECCQVLLLEFSSTAAYCCCCSMC